MLASERPLKAQCQARAAFLQHLDAMTRDAGDAAGLLAPLEVGGRIPDGDVPCSLWQLRLFEAYAAALGHRSGREQLDDVDRFDPPRPCFEGR